MKLKRLLLTASFTAALAAAAALVATSCKGEWGEPVSWRMSVDLPMNFSVCLKDEPGWQNLLDSLDKMDGGDPLLSDSADASPDSLLFWATKPETFPASSDFMDALKKMTAPNIACSLRLSNGTARKLTFYGMLFGGGDAAARLDSAAFYKLATTDASDKRVNILGAKGLTVNPGSDTSGAMPPVEGQDFCNLLTREKTIACRWLVTLNKKDKGVPDSLKTKPVFDDSLKIKLRIRFSGVNCFDSLFTL